MRVTTIRWLARGAGLAALAALGGCVVAPPAYEVGAPVAYPDGYTTYYDGGPYYGYPYVWGPSVSVDVYRGWGGGPRWYGPPPPRRGGYGPGPWPRPGGAGPGPRPGGPGGRPGPRPGGGGAGPAPRPPIGLGPGPGMHEGGAVSAPVPPMRGRGFDQP